MVLEKSGVTRFQNANHHMLGLLPIFSSVKITQHSTSYSQNISFYSSAQISIESLISKMGGEFTRHLRISAILLLSAPR